MQTRITARHFDAPDPLRAHIEQSVGRLTQYFDGIHGAHVVLDGALDGEPRKHAEVVLNLNRQTLTAREEAPTHQAAVDACLRRLRRQVTQHKDRLRDHKGRGTPRP
ncbi:MAG TPA: ribosome-associated translation inhibitor RaiA [Rubricoccaceae bacterium]|nr:ribosome-associated translation inhibitor RaiA [Rubricoccaceae bacterium]